MMIDVEQLIGVGEIADLGRVTKACVSQWATRHPDFPKPVAVLKCGPIYNSEQIIEWMERHDK